MINLENVALISNKSQIQITQALTAAVPVHGKYNEKHILTD